MALGNFLNYKNGLLSPQVMIAFKLLGGCLSHFLPTRRINHLYTHPLRTPSLHSIKRVVSTRLCMHCIMFMTSQTPPRMSISYTIAFKRKPYTRASISTFSITISQNSQKKYFCTTPFSKCMSNVVALSNAVSLLMLMVFSIE